MSDINLDFTVSNNSIEFTVQPNEITITPTDIQLELFTGSSPTPGGTSGELQYNNNGILDGVPNTLYDGSNLTLGNVANIRILGGVNGYVLQTDGTGNLNWTAQSGNGGGNGTPGGANSQIQYNDNGLFGGNAGFTFNEVTGNVAIPGALTLGGNLSVSTYISGILSTPSQTNITAVGTLGNLTVAGNTDVANLNATNNISGTGNLSITGNANIGNANIGSLRINDGRVVLGAAAGQPVGLNDPQQAVAVGYGAGALNQGTDAIAIGDGAGSNNQGNFSIAIGGGAGYQNQGNNSIVLNASGTQWSPNTSNALFVKPIRNANTANALFYNSNTGEITFDNALTANFVAYAGNVTVNAQPNITSLGTLVNLSVTGNITSSSNINATSNVVASRLISNIGTGTAPFVVTSTTRVSNLNVANAGYADNAGTAQNAVIATQANNSTLAGTVTTNAQPNITSVGTLTSLIVSGNATVGNLIGPHANGNSNIIINNNGNIAMTVGGQGNVFVLTSNKANFYGEMTVSNNIIAIGNISATNISATGTGNFTGNLRGGNLVTSGTLSVTGNATVGNLGAGLITGTLTTSTQTAIQTVGTLTSLTVSGNSQFGANANNTANFAGPVTVGNATIGSNLRIWGNVTAGGLIQNSILYDNGNIGVFGNYDSAFGNINLGQGSFVTTSGRFIGSGANLTNLNGANVAGEVYSANIVTNPSQTSITAVGTLGNLTVSGNLTYGTLKNGNAPSAATSTTITHKAPIVLNGVTYYICLTSTI